MKAQDAKSPAAEQLFDRIVAILEAARTRVVRAVNSHMVIAYWLIGRELVRSIQNGDERAEYGKAVMDLLSKQLNQQFGKGFSTTNLRYFRQFYLTFADRRPEIRQISGNDHPPEIRHKPCGEFGSEENGSLRHDSKDVLSDLSAAIENGDVIQGFSPTLS
jgi:hypothetical protein